MYSPYDLTQCATTLSRFQNCSKLSRLELELSETLSGVYVRLHSAWIPKSVKRLKLDQTSKFNVTEMEIHLDSLELDKFCFEDTQQGALETLKPTVLILRNLQLSEVGINSLVKKFHAIDKIVVETVLHFTHAQVKCQSRKEYYEYTLYTMNIL
jgi:hypothetical protein